MLRLEIIKRTDPRILANMAIHYSKPKGFVGRNICYAILFNDIYYGAIVGGSSTLHLVGRDEYFGFTKETKKSNLNNLVNNIFFHVEKVNGEYPLRWFTARVINLFRYTIARDWEVKYGDKVIGFETLVELPRTGDCYKKDGWELVGQTKGFTCKRGAGKGTDNWSGKRVWDTENLRPKWVFCKKAT
jgi:Domain of unknown function (DUF4338)